MVENVAFSAGTGDASMDGFGCFSGIFPESELIFGIGGVAR